MTSPLRFIDYHRRRDWESYQMEIGKGLIKYYLWLWQLLLQWTHSLHPAWIRQDLSKFSCRKQSCSKGTYWTDDFWQILGDGGRVVIFNCVLPVQQNSLGQTISWSYRNSSFISLCYKMKHKDMRRTWREEADVDKGRDDDKMLKGK